MGSIVTIGAGLLPHICPEGVDIERRDGTRLTFTRGLPTGRLTGATAHDGSLVLEFDRGGKALVVEATVRPARPKQEQGIPA